MKELSIEEKAKRYDEAIERAKAYQGLRSEMEIIFPELKESESEDEKAIRDIKVVLESSATKFFKEEGKMPIWYDRAVAWLENQGSQILANSCKTCKDGQKPAESINDVYPETLDKAIDLYYYSYGNGNGYFENLSFEKFKDIAKTFVSDYSKQKPAWSEEDEAGLSDAMWAIEQARTIAKDENDMGNLWYAEHWLKSLKERYTWKPSDEQIEALESATENCAYSEYQGCLRELIEQLKKLRGA